MRYSTNADLHQLLPRGKKLSSKGLGSPLVILNGFGSQEVPKTAQVDGRDEFSTGDQERRIMSTMLNNLFPSLDLGFRKPSSVKRVVLVNFDASRDLVEWRHYYVKQQPADLNNKLRKMVSNKRLPNLSEVKDLSQYFAGNVGYVSESDVDNLPNSKLQIEESTKSGLVTKKKVGLRLFEIGPRMTLKLVKIEEGFLGVKELHVGRSFLPSISQEDPQREICDEESARR
jgi:ribosome biogenesis protein SSF1/2